MLQSISHLAHALSNLRLDSNSLIRICWPSERCRLLKEDVVFVDRSSYSCVTFVASRVIVTLLNLECSVLVCLLENSSVVILQLFYHELITEWAS